MGIDGSLEVLLSFTYVYALVVFFFVFFYLCDVQLPSCGCACTDKRQGALMRAAFSLATHFDNRVGN